MNQTSNYVDNKNDYNITKMYKLNYELIILLLIKIFTSNTK